MCLCVIVFVCVSVCARWNLIEKSSSWGMSGESPMNSDGKEWMLWAMSRESPVESGGKESIFWGMSGESTGKSSGKELIVWSMSGEGPVNSDGKEWILWDMDEQGTPYGSWWKRVNIVGHGWVGQALWTLMEKGEYCGESPVESGGKEWTLWGMVE